MKPRIAIIADVRGWAWDRKARALQQHLGDEFDLSTHYLYDRHPDAVPAGVDLYHTFEVFQSSLLPEGAPYVTGITAHVWPGLEERCGRMALLRWAMLAEAFHANSVLLQREAEERLGRPVAYCPNGVDETFFRRLRPAPADRLVVGWVGKPNPRKGADIVRQACALAGVELCTVERTYRNALSADDMREFYQGCNVVAVASDMDGTPNHALEGAACGCAVLGNRIGNLPEFIDGQNGVLVERSVAGLVAALQTLSPADAVRMGEAARATVERAWSWRVMAKNYGDMWRAALAGRARSAA